MFENGSFIDQRYRVIRLLGTGAFASVYWVEDVHSFNQPYALKVFNYLSKKNEVWEGIRNSLRFAHHLHHPNLLRVFNFGVIYPDGLPYLLSEYVSGATLARFEGVPSADLVRSIAAQLLSALKTLHGVGLLHLDVKPSNIMLSTSESGGVQAKLIDVGSFLIKQKLFLRNFPATYDYLEPVVVCGGTARETTDLYALGVSLFSWITGKHPFGHLSEEELLGGFRLRKDLLKDLDFRLCGEFEPLVKGLMTGGFRVAGEALAHLSIQSHSNLDGSGAGRRSLKRWRYDKEKFQQSINFVFEKQIRNPLLTNQMEKHFLLISGSSDQERRALICDTFLNFSHAHDLLFKRFQSIPQNSLFSFINCFTRDFGDLGAVGGLSRTEIVQSLFDPKLKGSFFDFIYRGMVSALRKFGPALFIFENLSQWDFVFLEFMVGLGAFLSKNRLPILMVLVFDHQGALCREEIEFKNPFLERLLSDHSFATFRLPSKKTAGSIHGDDLHHQFFSLVQTLPNPFQVSTLEKLFLVAPQFRSVFFDLLHEGAFVQDESWFYVRKLSLPLISFAPISREILEGLVREDRVFVSPLIQFFPSLRSTERLLGFLEEDLSTDGFQPFQHLIEIALGDEASKNQYASRLLFFKGRIQNYRGAVEAAIQSFEQALQFEVEEKFLFEIVVDLQNALAKKGLFEKILKLMSDHGDCNFAPEQKLFLQGIGLVTNAILQGPENLPIVEMQNVVQRLHHPTWRGRLNLRYAQALIWSKNHKLAGEVLDAVLVDFSTAGQNFRRARALRMKSKILRAQGNMPEALRLVGEALKILVKGDLPREEIEALIDFVFLKHRLGMLEGIDGDLARMAKILTFFPDQVTYRLVWLELMARSREMTRVDEALYFYTFLEKMARAQKKPEHLYIALVNRALLERRRGNQEEHGRLLKRARRIFKENKTKMPRRLQESSVNIS